MKHKILIVDDDALILGMYKIKFQNAGYQVVAVSDGKSGVDSFTHERPDLVLTDWMMPKMNGGHLVKAIRKIDQKQTPIIVVSNSFLEKDKQEAKKLGVGCFLTKAECTPGFILRKVDEMLQ